MCSAVANEVETEQVFDAGMDWKAGGVRLSSMVQVCCGR